MRLEHVGIAVESAEATASLLEELFGARPYKAEDVDSEAVRTLFFDAGGTKVELLEATSPDSPIARFLERRGQGLHHLAFEVDDIQAAYARLGEAGFQPLSDGPKRGADEKLIFFLHPRETAGVLVEVCQTEPKALEPEFADSDGRSVAFYQSGPPGAPPVVLLHAALGSAELELRGLATRLERRYRTVAMDFGGHGRSEDLAGTPSLETFRDDVLAVLAHLGLDTVSLVGFSMGGAVALRLAIDRPHRVDRVAAHATNAAFAPEEASALRRSLDPDRIRAENPGRAERLAASHQGERWRILARHLQRFITTLPDRPLLDDELRDVRRPVLVSHGDRDRFFRPERAVDLWRALPDARLAIHPGLGHVVEEAAIAPALLRFLDEPLPV